MIKILSELNNEYIIKYYDSFIKDDYFCILMEYGVNINLKQFIKKHKDESQFIDKNIIIDIIRQICKGLKTIHENNIIHRDLTPDNIFLDGNNKIKIGDFGVSKLLNTNNHYAKTKTGKYHYFAPEIENGKYNNKVDIYALGCIAYELFTLNEYYIDKIIDNKDGKIDLNIYNQKWQDLIELLLKNDYHERPSIEEVLEKLANEIILTVKINEADTHREIYFLNTNFFYNNLNELNTKLYINNIKYQFNEYFIPKKEGLYTIKICICWLYESENYSDYDLDRFNIRNAIDMSNMFDGCTKLENIDLSSFDTTDIDNMSFMFHNCINLKSIKLSSLNTKNVTNMSNMFNGCSNLESIDLSSFDTKNVRNMSNMFYGCSNLKNIDLSSFNIINNVDTNYMLSNCQKLNQIKIKQNFYDKMIENCPYYNNKNFAKKIIIIDNN